MSDQTVAGIDIHKDFLKVTVLRSKDKRTKEYGTQHQELVKLKRWLAQLQVEKIAIEATSVYMVPCLDLLKDRFEMYLVNASVVQHIPGKKTDALDSGWLALLLQKNLLKKSYIPSMVWREIRELYRQAIAQAQSKSRVKNRLHKILVQEGFYLSRVFSDIFGQTSRLILEGLSNGKTIKEIISLHETNTYIQRKQDLLLEFLPPRKNLSHSIAMLLKLLLDELDQGEQRISILEDQIAHLTQEKLAKSEEVKILLSVPGFSHKSAKGVLAEIGEISRFSRGKQLVNYAGLAPGIHESGGKKKRKAITKRGNKYLRTALVEAAHAAVRTKRSRLRGFYFRLSQRIGRKKAIVALASKLLRIVHAILTKGERYEEDYFRKDEKLLYLPEAKQVFSLGELDQVLRGRGLRIAANFKF